MRKITRRKMIDNEIKRLILKMEVTNNKESDEYKQMAIAVVMLDKSTTADVSTRNTWLLVGANLTGIVVVLLFEAFGHSITSRSWGNILKGRV